MNPTDTLVPDTLLAAAAGYAGAKVMEQFSMKTYQLEPEDDRKREEAVRPGPPFRIAAENLSGRVLGIELSEEQASKAGMAFHLLAGPLWAPVYALLRRKLGWGPVTSGLAAGASLSLILDEIITPAIGASAPNRAYPPSTLVRAFVAHLIFGMAVAGVFEAGWKLLGKRPLRTTQMMNAQQVMTSDPACCGPSAAARDAAKQMVDHDYCCFPRSTAAGRSLVWSRTATSPPGGSSTAKVQTRRSRRDEQPGGVLRARN